MARASTSPEEYGGGGGGAMEVAILLEELGKSFLDLAFWVFRAVTWGGLAIGRDGQEELKRERSFPKVADGSTTVCFSLTEPEAGSDAAAIALTATRGWRRLHPERPEGLHLGFQGQRPGCGGNRTAKGERKHHGITLFVVDCDAPGISWTAMETLGHWPLGTAHVFFDDVRVPKSRMLGTLHNGWADNGVYLRYERSASQRPGPARPRQRCPMPWNTPRNASSSANQCQSSKRSAIVWPRCR